MLQSITLLMLSFFLLSAGVDAEIYKWTDAQGKVHFGDSKPEAYEPEQLNLQINTYTSISYEDILHSPSNNSSGSSSSVVLYSTEWCGYCKKAKAYFKTKNIAFTEYDIEKDLVAKKRYQAMGAKGVPVIIVGKKRMNGFSVSGFERIYH